MQDQTGLPLVGLMTDHNPNLLIGMLGILKSGNGFVPIDPALPQQRIEFLVNDCDIEVIVTESKWREKALEIAQRTPTLKHIILAEELSDEATGNAQSIEKAAIQDAKKPVYVIYTSGSTGTPKGVPITHENIVPLLQWSKEYFGFGDHTRTLQNLSYCFDFGIYELLTTILFGGTLYFFDKNRVSLSSGYSDFAKQNAINTVHTTPSIFREVMTDDGQWTSLNVLHLGGEQLTTNAVDEILKTVGEDCKIYNGYGPTEASVNSTLFEVGDKRSWNASFNSLPSAISIGKPTANNAAYVLDKNLRPVPVGVKGELHVGGVGLSSGYINAPELTAEKFVPDPYTSEPGARLYKTGDLVRFRADGNIEFIGRKDFQVKVRGYRIETGEVEAALTSHPSIRDALVTACEDGHGNKSLVAYVITREQQLNPAALRDHLKKQLPDYMVPSAFLCLDSFPINLNGKVDMRALPSPESLLSSRFSSGESPRTPVEELLAGIFAELLNVPAVGIHDDFFELGGHSLLATQLAARVRKAFHVEMPLLDLFKYSSVADLAAHIELSAGINAASVNAPGRRKLGSADAPLSYAQQRLWFFQCLAPESPFYNMAAAIKLEGPLDLAALKQSFDEVLRRHGALRTTFQMRGDNPVQVIAEKQELELPVIDLSLLPQALIENEIERLKNEEAQRPFDLTKGPLIRLAVARSANESHIALVNMHHIVSDGWSINILFREALTLYRAYSTGEPSPFDELELQYADYAEWQREWLQGDVFKTQLGYWKQQLRGLNTSMDLPFDYPRPELQSFRGAYHTFELSEALTDSLKRLSRKEDATLFMTLLTALKALLFRYTGQEDIVIGSPIANRRWVELESLIGFFVNMLVLRTDLSETPTFADLLRRVRRVCLDAYANQDMPFEKLVEELQPDRDQSGHTPLFQVSFVLQNRQIDNHESSDLKFSFLNTESKTAKFDLWLSMTETEGSLSATLEYNTDLFKSSTICRMADQYKILLEEIAADPDRPLASLPLAREQEVNPSPINKRAEIRRRRSNN